VVGPAVRTPRPPRGGDGRRTRRATARRSDACCRASSSDTAVRPRDAPPASRSTRPFTTLMITVLAVLRHAASWHRWRRRTIVGACAPPGCNVGRLPLSGGAARCVQALDRCREASRCISPNWCLCYLPAAAGHSSATDFDPNVSDIARLDSPRAAVVSMGAMPASDWGRHGNKGG
jgi:hypothetical protein